MAIELRGFDDLQNDMVNMAYALDQGAGVNRALKAGAVPIEEQMLHNASTDPKIITDKLFHPHGQGKAKARRGQADHHRRSPLGIRRVLRQPCGVRPRRPCARARASLCAPCL